MLASIGHISQFVRRHIIRDITSTKFYLSNLQEEPIIGVISTGDELLEPGSPLKPGKIYDSNMTMLAELLKQFGFSRVKTIIAQDK